MKIISYYTKGTSYELEVPPFLKSASQFDIDVEVVGVVLGDDWRENTLYKPQFILERLVDEPILWVDIDARFFKRIEGLPKCDLAYHRAEGFASNDWRGYRTGTLLFYPTTNARKFVKKWADYCAEHKAWLSGDQEAFFEILQQGPDLDIAKLDNRYVHVSSLDSEVADVVICHYQASRIYSKHIHTKVGPDSATIEMIRNLKKTGLSLEEAIKVAAKSI